MFKTILLSTVMLLLFAGLTYSQTDIGLDTKFNVTDKYGITPEEEAVLNSQVNIERNIPQYLLNQLELARRNENIEEMNRIQNIIDTKYNNGVYIVKPNQYPSGLEPVPCYADNQIPPYNPDWQGTDITVYTGNSSNLYTRPKALDMKLGEDGNMYIAMIVNRSDYHGIRVYRSTNSGLTWVYRGGVTNTTQYFLSLSMLTERRHASNNDSLRICIYYTYGASSNNDDASLNFFSFKPNASTPDYLLVSNVVNPPAGSEVNFPCAVSDGQYYSTVTWMGCVVGEYNNAGTAFNRFHYVRTTNWGTSHTATTFDPGWLDKNLSAAFMNKSNDSVYIAVERDMAPDEVRVITIPFTPTSAFFTRYTTSGGPNTRPVISIQQTAQSVDKKIVMTYRNSSNIGKYAFSLNGGNSFTLDATLDTRNAPTTNWTYVSMDTNNAGGGYLIGLWSDNDSLTIRRGAVNSMGVTMHKRNSTNVTGDALPLCAIYNNSGNFKQSAISYYGFSGVNVYYDGENLPTGITNTNEIANTYSMSQNFPNPFNPTTSINFSIPKDGLVKIVVYDVLGKEVATLVNGEQTTGTYQVTFDASKLTSGIYFYKITSGDFSDVKKMLLVK
ncbi:MAG: T9SS type A sorting domain-containing protein [Ignavibacteria bacterium]|nr:T9SS type A sorting domain-containing protein [Ignavibacteria bacterium]